MGRAAVHHHIHLRIAFHGQQQPLADGLREPQFGVLKAINVDILRDRAIVNVFVVEPDINGRVLF